MTYIADKEQMLAIGADGNYRCPNPDESELIAVVQTDKGQETLTLKEFTAKHGFRNSPGAVKWVRSLRFSGNLLPGPAQLALGTRFEVALRLQAEGLPSGPENKKTRLQMCKQGRDSSPCLHAG